MPGNPRIQDLIRQLLESNRSPDDVCAEHPELLWEVRKRWKRVQSVQAHLAELFPPSTDVPQAPREMQSPSDDALPDIPGYRIEGEIGRGGMGIVYKACHLKLNRQIA